MTDHHPPQEQLSLNFGLPVSAASSLTSVEATAVVSTKDFAIGTEAEKSSATVYYLPRNKTALLHAETARLYEQIIASVKHIS